MNIIYKKNYGCDYFTFTRFKLNNKSNDVYVKFKDMKI